MYAKCCLPLLLLLLCGAIARSEPVPATKDAKANDLATAETSAKLLNLGGLFGQGSGYPNYGYNYPNYGYSTGYYNRPNTGYYPSSGAGYYPSSTYNGAGFYPSTGGGYYPSSGYYPTTNILGTSGYGGYGGYGGNGGLRQYSGYWQPEYSGQRYRGYGYYRNTDRYGLPIARERDYYRDRGSYGSYGGYRGYD
ncbi:hypothetical protein AWZ03_006392 [Drosophila navojoa]|uniref:Prisilkin-39 n=1 Tax=Drosophila navojoa TaxID=7232 RepID=A0A484BE44_DRONA|nr:prisilkin-39 isoform X1 [Drosophila navojoa]TDG47127.1 hypothetical protein AWZ03_006392 [Drosophila navojoa]